MKLGIYLAYSILTVLPLAAQQRTFYDVGHLDLSWAYENGDWSVMLFWDDEFDGSRVNPVNGVKPFEGVLIAKDEPYPEEGSRTMRPPGSQWDFIGVDEGELVWLYPSGTFENPILGPGFATDVVPSDGPGDVRINLLDVVFHGEGDWHFSMYLNADDVFMTTSDGIDESDFYLMARNDHQHITWAFTAKGVYELTLTASFLEVAGDEGSRITSDPETFIFAVAASPMELWLLEQGVNPAELGDADSPAGDGVPNLLKYALGLPPLVAVGSVVEPVFFDDGGEEFLALDLALNPQAEGISVRVETSGDLVDWQSGAGHTVVLEHSADRIRVRDAVAAEDAGRRFIRLAVERDGGE